MLFFPVKYIQKCLINQILFILSENEISDQPERTMEQGNVPDLHLISQIPGEDLSGKTMEQPESLSQQSTDSSAIPNNTNNEPHSQPVSSGLATHEESSTRSSVFHETDDSDDDPVLIPGARYRGGVGHRLVLLCLFPVFKNFAEYLFKSQHSLAGNLH